MRKILGETAPAWLAGLTSCIALVSASGAVAVAAPWFAPPDPGATTSADPVADPVADASPAPAPAAAPAPTPAPAAPPAPAPVAPAAPCAPVARLAFAYGAAAPPGDAAAELAAVIAHATAHADATVVVDGHADQTGDELGNLVLSKRRASRVADVLAAAGVPRARIVVRAFGAYVPAPGEPASSQRRVRVSAFDPRCPLEDRP